MDLQITQLVNYIQRCSEQGFSEPQIRDLLARSGWPSALVDGAFRNAGIPHPQSTGAVNQFETTPPTQEPSHNVRNGLLWIASPYIILSITAVLNLLLHAGGINSPVINIFSALAGVVGVILVPVGLVVGIIKLAR